MPIRLHPFFRDVDRYTAHLLTLTLNKPVLRHSSIPDRFALTFLQGTTVVHTLLNEHPDGKIDLVNEEGMVYAHVDTINTLFLRFIPSFVVSSTTPDPSTITSCISTEDPK
jgi:hypothetical protein